MLGFEQVGMIIDVNAIYALQVSGVHHMVRPNWKNQGLPNFLTSSAYTCGGLSP